MSVWEALILGILQGLTEFLPVSSSGHLEIGRFFLTITSHDNLAFITIVHFATVLSTIVVFRNDIRHLIVQFFRFRWNEETQFLFKIAVSMIPVGIVGLLFEDYIDEFFEGRLFLVGLMLLVTAGLLFLTRLSPGKKKPVGFLDAFIIGIAQMLAIIPGISRSGATISTALLLGVDKEKATRFSFLMVLLPIIGASILKIGDIAAAPEVYSKEIPALAVGFAAAFLSGVFACRAMISIVKRERISIFAVYCFVVGLLAIGAAIYYDTLPASLPG